MWPFGQISSWMARLARPRLPSLLVDQKGFAVCKCGEVPERFSWDDVDRIIAFKLDLGTYDEICLQIDISGRTEPLVVSEEFEAYKQFTEAMERQLPGVNQGWWSKVAFPAFAENMTVVYSRSVGARADGGGE